METLNSLAPAGSIARDIMRELFVTLAVALIIVLLKRAAAWFLQRARLVRIAWFAGWGLVDSILRSDRNAFTIYCAFNSTLAIVKMCVAVIAFVAAGASYVAHRFTITSSVTALTIVYWIAVLGSVGHVLDLGRLYVKFFLFASPEPRSFGHSKMNP